MTLGFVETEVKICQTQKKTNQRCKSLIQVESFRCFESKCLVILLWKLPLGTTTRRFDSLLKTHTTIKHRLQSKELLPDEFVLKKEALKVINSIENRIEELDDEEANTLNETCDLVSKDAKEYSENCQNCGFEAIAERKYLAF